MSKPMIAKGDKFPLFNYLDRKAGEFVKITRLPQINSTPYYVEVQRQPFGTFT